MSLTDAPPVAAKDPAAARRRRQRLIKRLSIGLVGLMTILLVVFLLLPQWISNEQGRAYVLQQLNKRGRATLSVGNWSLGWFHGTELSDVKISLPDGTLVAACPLVRSDLTLWGILWGHYDMGTTTADKLQLNITKYKDGSTSLNALFPNDSAGLTRLTRAMQTLRGSLLTKGSSVQVTSEATGESAAYHDVKAAVILASPDAPFHVQLSTLGEERSVSLNATLPALATWPSQRATAILVASDFDFAATQTTVRLLCDFLNADPAWKDSFGPTVVSATLSNHPAPAQPGTILSALLRGPTPDTFVDGRLLLTPPTGSSPSTLELPTMGDYSLRLGLNVSRPLASAFAHVNPIFSQLTGGGGPINISVSSLRLAPAALGATSLTARMTFPSLVFQRSGLIAQLLGQSTGATVPAPPSALAATAGPLRLRLANGRFESESFTLTFNRRERITFRGNVAVHGAVDMLATVPTAESDLGSGTADIPIQGTVDSPVLAPEQ